MAGLRVMTYSVGGFRGSDGRTDLERIATVIAEGAPALVALQQCPTDRALLDQLATRLGMRLFAAGGDSAYLADLPLRGVRGYDLGGGSCLRADTDVGGRRLHLFNVRLGGSRGARRRQLATLLGPELLAHRDLAGGCLLLGELCGGLWRLRLHGGLRSVPRPWWSPTSPARFPWRQGARAYCSAGVLAGDARVLTSATARAAAPHLPFLFSLQLTDPRCYLRLERSKPFGRRGQMEIAPG